MEDFSNNPISFDDLPRFESVELHPVQPSYWKIIRFNLVILVVLLLLAHVVVYFTADLMWVIMGLAMSAVLVAVLFIVYKRGLQKMGYAFRERDVIFRHGVITTTTTVIPYNRIQHVALHEGWLSRMLGLAKIQLYTAGTGTGDISIPGLEASTAASLKQLLMGKIQQEL